MSVAEIAQPVRSRLRAPFMWGLVVGVAQAATPSRSASRACSSSSPPPRSRGTPWLLVVGLAGHGVKDLWQHRRHFVANTRWWPPFCLVVDWVVAAIIAVEIVAGVHFQHLEGPAEKPGRPGLRGGRFRRFCPNLCPPRPTWPLSADLR